MVINKYLAELVGTFILVLLGSMSITAATGALNPDLAAPLILVVGLGFGLALFAGIVAVGHVSGAHFNPAVTLAMWLDKRTSTSDVVGYVIAQVVGAVLASLVLLTMTDQATVAGTITGFGGNGAQVALISEFVLTMVFVFVILATTVKAPAMAPVAISLTLVSIHLAGIPFSGSSVNPARSFAPALVGTDVTGFWVYIVGPFAGAVAGWFLWRLFGDDGVEV